jgi:SNF2 family DNA or RNA helicase
MAPMGGELLLSDRDLVLRCEQGDDDHDKIRGLPSARWDRSSRTWRMPLERTDIAVQFALDNEWWIAPEIVEIHGMPETLSSDLLSFDGEHVHLIFPYDPVKVRAVKQIPSITWNKGSKGWTAPAGSLNDAVEWADRFRIRVDEETRKAAQKIVDDRNSMVEASRSPVAHIQVSGLPLLDYQKAGVKYAAAAKRCFIADDMGLGKTLQAIATVDHLDSYPVLVVCPPTLVLNWAKEYEKWLPERKVATVKNRKDFPEPGFDVLVVGYSNIKAWENDLKNFRSYIFDESHYCKSPDAQRTKAAVKIAKTAPEDGVVLCLTGTPITNKPAEYASQLQIIGKLDEFGGKWGFYRRYCNAFRDRFGQWNIDGHSNLDELNERLRGSCYIRRTKDQVLHELPPVRHHVLAVDGTAGGMREYRKAEQDIVKYLMDRAAELARELGEKPGSAAVRAKMKAEANQHLVRIGVLRKLAARAKMPAVAEFVDSHLEEGKKVVIAAHHREIVDELASKYGNLKIQGAMDVEEIERHKSRFQEMSTEDAPAIVLSIQAAKTGHTLTAAEDVLFVELPWTPADVDQTYSRCHRLGQAGSVTSTYLLCAGTIDEEIFSTIERKRSVVNQAVEGGELNPSGAGAEVFSHYLELALE